MTHKLQAWTTGSVVLSRPSVEAGGWLSVQQSTSPIMARDRVGRHAATTLFGTGNALHSEQYVRSDRLLTDEQLWLVYQRTPDVRACVDAITRRVATWDWLVEPRLAPSDPGWTAAQADADLVADFLRTPNTDGETWQELWCKVVTDLMVFDAGVIENVFNGTVQPDGVVSPTEHLAELVALRGSSVFPAVDSVGHVLGYHQSVSGLSNAWVMDGDGVQSPEFGTEQIVYLRLFPTTAGPLGVPLIETLVNEIITMLRSSEHSMLSFDADEIPPGILVLTGIAGKAAQMAKADLQQLRGKDHKVRVITNPDPKATGAHWVELRHTAKDVDFVNVVQQVRRTIWRVFGVLPVEMGDSENVPRAVGQVQLDVSASHLINPILELIEAKINARILPMIVRDQSAVRRIRFRFDRESKLSADDQRSMAETLVSLVREGLLTRNEARAVRGDAPVEGGDTMTLTTGQGVFPLVDVIGPSATSSMPDGQPPQPDEPPPTPEAPPEAAPEQPAPDQGASATSMVPPMPVACGHNHRAISDPALPSAWQSPGPFKSHRTLDLVALHDVVADYTRAVRPLYAKAQSEATAALRAAYSPGELRSEDAERLTQRINASLDKLDTEWAVAADAMYQTAARIGVNAARDFTGQKVLLDWRSRAAQYADRAMAFLRQPGGLLSDLRARVHATVNALVAERARAPGTTPSHLTADVDVTVASEAMFGAFEAESHRITNWSGRLVELANETLAAGALAGASAVVDGQVRATEWWVQWVYVGDKNTCATCEAQGLAGLRPLSALPTVPGGDTECRANCRCVLVLWEKREVDSSDAVVFGPLR